MTIVMVSKYRARIARFVFDSRRDSKTKTRKFLTEWQLHADERRAIEQRVVHYPGGRCL